MLKYSNQEKTEFEIKFTNKKNPIWTKKDISLFKAMDDLSAKPRKRTNYDEDCKGRFRANLMKLCLSGFLKYVGKRKEKPSVTIVTYKILRYPGDKPAKAKSKRKRKNRGNMDKTVVNVIEEIENPGASFNGNNYPSTNYSNIAMQGRNVEYTAYSNNIEEIENPVASFYGNNYSRIDYSNNIAMQGRDVACTTYSNNIEQIENPDVSFNGNNFPSMDYSNISMKDVVYYTTYGNNIEEIENPGVSFTGNNFPSMDYSNISMKDVVYSTTYGINCTKGFGDFEEKIIFYKDPVFSSAWKKEEMDNADIIKGSPDFLHSNDDWMENGSLVLE